MLMSRPNIDLGYPVGHEETHPAIHRPPTAGTTDQVVGEVRGCCDKMTRSELGANYLVQARVLRASTWMLLE